MVTGINSFKEQFKDMENQYAIIGGTACDLLMSEILEQQRIWISFLLSKV